MFPFSVLSMLVFCFTIYGMSGLRRSGGALVQHGVLATLAYLCGSQVGKGLGGEGGWQGGRG